MRVEVVYAARGEVDRTRVDLPDAATVADALLASGIRTRHPGLGDTSMLSLGIFGRFVTPANRLEDGDRVEIYSPLVADPKQARRNRRA